MLNNLLIVAGMRRKRYQVSLPLLINNLEAMIQVSSSATTRKMTSTKLERPIFNITVHKRTWSLHWWLSWIFYEPARRKKKMFRTSPASAIHYLGRKRSIWTTPRPLITVWPKRPLASQVSLKVWATKEGRSFQAAKDSSSRILIMTANNAASKRVPSRKSMQHVVESCCPQHITSPQRSRIPM